ncbi:MAG: DUF6125 family protein [Chloroflexi bacterium]|nr:DUF6125 family protein [Chloroflexota bacterium]
MVTGLPDNSGDYNPNRKLTDFSVDFLANLALEYARAYLGTDGFWHGAVADKVGATEAMDCELLVWRRIANHVIPRIAKLANIPLPVKDVVEALKVWQMLPDQILPEVYTIKYDIKDRNHAIGTVTRCATLERFEKNAPGMIQTLCHGVEVDAVVAQCRVLHPDLKMTPLKLPPRKSRDEIACQWDYRLEPGPRAT